MVKEYDTDTIGKIWFFVVCLAGAVGFFIGWAHAAPDIRPFTGYYKVTASFWEPRNSEQAYHLATDYATPVGTTINCTDSGIVERVFDNGPAGLTIFVDHGIQAYRGKTGKLQTRYLHLYQSLVQPGYFVEKGTFIAKSGRSGYQQLGDYCTPLPPHLHYAIYFSEQYVDKHGNVRYKQAYPVNAAEFIFGNKEKL